MLERIRGIVIDSIKYSDTRNVVTLFTRSRGRMAVLSNTGSSPAARMRNAALQPLSVIETDINIKQQNSLQLLGRFSSPCRWRNIYFDPFKSAIALFLSEFLKKYLQDAAPDELLWDFTLSALQRLDVSEVAPANFHIAFLIGMMPLAGIEPPLTNLDKDDYFDLRRSEGVPRLPAHHDYLLPADTRLMKPLTRINLRNYHLFRMPREDRQRLLSILLKYYSVHFPQLAYLKSPAVLQELFS